MYMRYFTLMMIYEFPVIKLKIGLFVIRSSDEENFNTRIFVLIIHEDVYTYRKLCYLILIFQDFRHLQIPN